MFIKNSIYVYFSPQTMILLYENCKNYNNNKKKSNNSNNILQSQHTYELINLIFSDKIKTIIIIS